MIRFAMTALVALAVFLPGQAMAQEDAAKEAPRTFEIEEGDTTYTMKRYVFVILLRGESAFDYTEAQLDSLQKGHMENMDKLAEEGILLIAGPFGEGGDHRGILVMDCASIEEAKSYVDNDPAVQAGRLRGEYHTWWGAVGTQLK